VQDIQIQMCALCEKPILPKEPRVNFGRKTMHGECFVNHCKKHHVTPREGK
jgi:hypothetical protein